MPHRHLYLFSTTQCKLGNVYLASRRFFAVHTSVASVSNNTNTVDLECLPTYRGSSKARNMSTAANASESPMPSVHPTIQSIRSMRKSLSPSASVGFVPTMGALHEGLCHSRYKCHASKVLCSRFIISMF